MKYFLFLFLFLTSFLFGQDDMANMRKYYLVELLRIPDRPVLDSLTSATIHTAHLNNIDSLPCGTSAVLCGGTPTWCYRVNGDESIVILDVMEIVNINTVRIVDYAICSMLKIVKEVITIAEKNGITSKICEKKREENNYF